MGNDFDRVSARYLELKLKVAGALVAAADGPTDCRGEPLDLGPLAGFVEDDLVEVVERVQIGADGKPDESTRSIEVLGPATSADLLELDAVPEPVDSAAPAATYLPGCAPIGPTAETRPHRKPA